MVTRSTTREPVGLLAGSGRFPILFAEKAKALGIPVVCTGIRGEAAAELQRLAHRFHWVSIARMGSIIRCYQRAGVARAVMAGKVQKTTWHNPITKLIQFVPDWRTVKWYFNKKRTNNSDDNLLLSVIAEFAKDGITFVSALDYCPELLVTSGILTKRAPTAREHADIDFGWELAKEMGRLDVGQSVSVKDRSVLAVEAIEGTDQSILRAGQLCRSGGFVVVKVAKPQQDMRFDVPTIGVSTIQTMNQAGARVLAVEADKTIIVDRPETIALADRFGMSIVAVARAA